MVLLAIVTALTKARGVRDALWGEGREAPQEATPIVTGDQLIIVTKSTARMLIVAGVLLTATHD